MLEWQADRNRVGDSVYLTGTYHPERGPEGDSMWNVRNQVEYDWSNWSEDDIKSLEAEYKNVLDTIENVIGGSEAELIVDNWLTWYDIETGKMLFHRE